MQETVWPGPPQGCRTPRHLLWGVCEAGTGRRAPGHGTYITVLCVHSLPSHVVVSSVAVGLCSLESLGAAADPLAVVSAGAMNLLLQIREVLCWCPSSHVATGSNTPRNRDDDGRGWGQQRCRSPPACLAMALLLSSLHFPSWKILEPGGQPSTADILARGGGRGVSLPQGRLPPAPRRQVADEPCVASR